MQTETEGTARREDGSPSRLGLAIPLLLWTVLAALLSTRGDDGDPAEAGQKVAGGFAARVESAVRGRLLEAAH